MDNAGTYKHLVMRSIEDKEGAPVIETPSKMGLVSRV